jgi:hypothetical protein
MQFDYPWETWMQFETLGCVATLEANLKLTNIH